MEEQMKAYYDKVQEMFPEYNVTVGCSIKTNGVKPWYIGVKSTGKPCKCCGQNKAVDIFVVADTFDAALAEIVALAGVPG